MGELFSRLWVQSLRGAPSLELNGLLPFVAVKFGNVQENVMRLIHESWVHTDDTNNAFCVVADSRNEYALNWASWASNTASQAFNDCSSLDDNVIDNCRNPAEPTNPVGAIIVPPRTNKKNVESQELTPEQKALKQRLSNMIR
jgi:hypothetical protein